MSTYEHYPDKLKFLNSEDSSLEEILEKTNLNESIDMEVLGKVLLETDEKLSRVITKKYSLPDEHLETLKRIKLNAEELL